MEEENKNENLTEEIFQEEKEIKTDEEMPLEDNLSVQDLSVNEKSETHCVEIQNTTVQSHNKNNNADMELVTVSPVEFVSFDEDKEQFSTDLKANLDILQDVKMHITVELGRAKSSVKKILDLTKGSIVELNKVAGEQVELYVNGKFVAWGEVIVIEDKFGLRVTNVSNQNLHNL